MSNKMSLSQSFCSIALIGCLALPCAAQTRPKSTNPTPTPTNPNSAPPATGTTGTTSPTLRPGRVGTPAATAPQTTLGFLWNTNIVAQSKANNDAMVASALGINNMTATQMFNPMNPFLNNSSLVNQWSQNQMNNPLTMNPVNPMMNNPFMTNQMNPMMNNPWQMQQMNPMMNNPWQMQQMNPMMNNPWQMQQQFGFPGLFGQNMMNPGLFGGMGGGF